MFSWYERAAICYVYLSEVTAEFEQDATPAEEFADYSEVERQIWHSKWFTRGWTLQELLAPSKIVFYNRDWQRLGTKDGLSLLLAHRTGIEDVILQGLAPISTACVAQRMSWASSRVTTRVEDTAYCLLGIFNVNMPMLYGEGRRAFVRLQEEIVKRSDDHSLFAWPIKDTQPSGLLADSPEAFATCQKVVSRNSRHGRSAYSLTNRGLSVQLPATPCSTDTYLVQLECDDVQLPVPVDIYGQGELRLGIYVVRLDEDDQYARVSHDGEAYRRVLPMVRPAMPPFVLGSSQSPQAVKMMQMNIREDSTAIRSLVNPPIQRLDGFRIASFAWSSPGPRQSIDFNVLDCDWDAAQRVLSKKHGSYGTVGILHVNDADCPFEMLKLGFDFLCNPVCFIAAKTGRDLAEEWAQAQGIYHRSPFDEQGWSHVRGKTAYQLQRYPGLWAVKGDRLAGLDVWIEDLASLRIIREQVGAPLVWNVYVNCYRRDREGGKRDVGAEGTTIAGSRRGLLYGQTSDPATDSVGPPVIDLGHVELSEHGDRSDKTLS